MEQLFENAETVDEKEHHGKHVADVKQYNFGAWALTASFLTIVFGGLHVLADAYTKVCFDPTIGQCSRIPFGVHMETLATVFFVAGIISIILGLLACIECFVRRESEGKASTAWIFMVLTAIFAGGGIASHILTEILGRVA